jgi:hypothetical protein
MTKKEFMCRYILSKDIKCYGQNRKIDERELSYAMENAKEIYENIRIECGREENFTSPEFEKLRMQELEQKRQQYINEKGRE